MQTRTFKHNKIGNRNNNNRLNELQKRKRREKRDCVREERLTELEEPTIAKIWRGITKEK